MAETATAPTPAAAVGQGAHGAHGDLKPGDHGWTHTGLTNEKLGMWLFLGTECLLFGGLISTYLLYKSRVPADDGSPIPSDLYDIPFTSVSSFVLLMSSLTMVLAVTSIARGDQRSTRIWLATTSALGSVFLAGQVYEFTAFVKEGMGFTTNVASSAFFTLTGFHGVHVSLGVIMLMSLLVMSVRGRLGPERAEAVEIIGLYWHFVDVVWILIFTVIYLVP